jgi:hypothetical protein
VWEIFAFWSLQRGGRDVELQKLADVASHPIDVLVKRAVNDALISKCPQRVVVVTAVGGGYTVDIRNFPTSAARDLFALLPVKVKHSSDVPDIIERLIRPSTTNDEVVILNEPSTNPPPIPGHAWRDVVVLKDMIRSEAALSYNCR